MTSLSPQFLKQRPAWFPDWRGHPVAIIASGPSAKRAKLDVLRGVFKVIAIKESWELFKDADAVYGCDAPFWRNALGLPNFKGLKLCYAGQITAWYPDIKIISIDVKHDGLLLDKPGHIASGGNSGQQAINLAVQFGATRIMLIGFDMHDRDGVHWYGRARGQGRANPADHNFRRWIKAAEFCAKALADSQVDVVNTSSNSDLKAYRRATIDQVMQEWDLCSMAA